MKEKVVLPEYVHRLKEGESFNFRCHSGVSCFTECCRMLELTLTPYDALRLKQGTNLSSQELLDNYIIIEQEPGEPFPRFYLTMVDDGRASCVFVSKTGCTIYEHRPAACRAYPLGRAVMRGKNDLLEEYFVLMKEKHCQGFQEPEGETAKSYSSGQGLASYNKFNDKMAAILQHPAIRQGFIPSKKQIELFILGLYNTDSFREQLIAGKINCDSLAAEQIESFQRDEEQLLLFAIDWLIGQLFSQFNTIL